MTVLLAVLGRLGADELESDVHGRAKVDFDRSASQGVFISFGAASNRYFLERSLDSLSIDVKELLGVAPADLENMERVDLLVLTDDTVIELSLH
jgi:hypothetical protein